MKNLLWVPLPIKLNGNGYVHLMSLDDGPSIFGCFISIIEIAASCKPRGELWRAAGIPHSSRTLAALIRQAPAVVDRMLSVCSSQDCDWIEVTEIPQEGAEIPQEGAVLLPLQVLQEGRKEGREGKGRAFAPPTLKEVHQYCQERGRGVNPEKWMAHYQANGWKVGKNPMKDWRAAVRTWEDDKKPLQSRIESKPLF